MVGYRILTSKVVHRDKEDSISTNTDRVSLSRTGTTTQPLLTQEVVEALQHRPVITDNGDLVLKDEVKDDSASYQCGGFNYVDLDAARYDNSKLEKQRLSESTSLNNLQDPRKIGSKRRTSYYSQSSNVNNTHFKGRPTKYLRVELAYRQRMGAILAARSSADSDVQNREAIRPNINITGKGLQIDTTPHNSYFVEPSEDFGSSSCSTQSFTQYANIQPPTQEREWKADVSPTQPNVRDLQYTSCSLPNYITTETHTPHEICNRKGNDFTYLSSNLPPITMFKSPMCNSGMDESAIHLESSCLCNAKETADGRKLTPLISHERITPLKSPGILPEYLSATLPTPDELFKPIASASHQEFKNLNPLQYTLDNAPHQARFDQSFDTPHQARFDQSFDTPHQARFDHSMNNPHQARFDQFFDTPHQARFDQSFDTPHQARFDQSFYTPHQARFVQSFDTPHQARFDQSILKHQYQHGMLPFDYRGQTEE